MTMTVVATGRCSSSRHHQGCNRRAGSLLLLGGGSSGGNGGSCEAGGGTQARKGGTSWSGAILLLLLLWFVSSTDPPTRNIVQAVSQGSQKQTTININRVQQQQQQQQNQQPKQLNQEFYARCRKYGEENGNNNISGNATSFLEDFQESKCEQCRLSYDPAKTKSILAGEKNLKKRPNVIVLLSPPPPPTQPPTASTNNQQQQQQYKDQDGSTQEQAQSAATHYSTFESCMVLTAGLLTKGFRVTVLLQDTSAAAATTTTGNTMMHQQPQLREEFLRPALSQHIPCHLQTRAHALLQFVTYKLDESTSTTLRHCLQARAHPNQAVHAVNFNNGGQQQQQNNPYYSGGDNNPNFDINAASGYATAHFQNPQQQQQFFFLSWSSQHVLGCSILTAAPVIQAMSNAVDFRKYDVLVADSTSVAGAFVAEAFLLPSILLVDSTYVLDKVLGILPPPSPPKTTTTTTKSLFDDDDDNNMNNTNQSTISWLYMYLKGCIDYVWYKCQSTYDGFDWTYAFVGINRVRRSLGLSRIRLVQDVWKAPGCVLWSLTSGVNPYRTKFPNLVGTTSSLAAAAAATATASDATTTTSGIDNNGEDVKKKPPVWRGTTTRPLLPPCLPCQRQKDEIKAEKKKNKKKNKEIGSGGGNSGDSKKKDKDNPIPTVAVSAGFRTNNAQGRKNYRSIIQGLSIARASLHDFIPCNNNNSIDSTNNNNTTTSTASETGSGSIGNNNKDETLLVVDKLATTTTAEEEYPCWDGNIQDFKVVFMTPLPDFQQSLPDWITSISQRSFVDILSGKDAIPTAAMISLCDHNNDWTKQLGPPVICWQHNWQPHEFAHELLQSFRVGNPNYHPPSQYYPQPSRRLATTNSSSANGTSVNGEKNSTTTTPIDNDNDDDSDDDVLDTDAMTMKPIDALEEIVNLTEKLAVIKKTLGKTNRWVNGYEMGKDIYNIVIKPEYDEYNNEQQNGNDDGGGGDDDYDDDDDQTKKGATPTPLLQVLLYPSWFVVGSTALYLMFKDSRVLRRLFRLLTTGNKRWRHHNQHHHHQSYSSSNSDSNNKDSYTAALAQFAQEIVRHSKEIDQLYAMWNKWSTDVSAQLQESGGSGADGGRRGSGGGGGNASSPAAHNRRNGLNASAAASSGASRSNKRRGGKRH